MKVNIIPIQNLALSFLPLLLVFLIFLRWKLNWKEFLYASVRMLIQLFCIGFVLNYIFNQNNPLWSLLIIIFMLGISAWISLHSIKEMRREKIKLALVSLLIGAVPVLLLVTILIIPSDKWYAPAFLIPLAGMVFSNAMNAVGLAAERFETEIDSKQLMEAKRISLNAALIPQINSFLAVGLVSLPGMMTGQILSGVNPLIAVRYQIVVMTMVMGAGGLSAAFYLSQSKRKNITRAL